MTERRSWVLACGMAAPLAAAMPLAAQDDAPVDPMLVSETDAIACRLDAARYNGFALSISGEEGIASARRWRRIKQPNPFLEEYELSGPITVAGHSTRRIAFSANAVVAVLDVADPSALAKPERITNAVDDTVAAIGLAAPGDAAARKFMGERVLVDRTEPAAEEGGYGVHEIVARTISNVTSHPGKTLYGCSYRMEMLDEDGQPL